VTELPPRLVVIGGGPLACEMAQAFRRVGSEVDLVSATTNLLPNDEPGAVSVEAPATRVVTV
jgi:pyruvate/2-oxoglutarate dehydrogenase complex dihydrolipoamide dehydrogenase (E3) component